MHQSYEYVLSPQAENAIADWEPEYRWNLYDALSVELLNGPNEKSEWSFDHGGHTYTATPLSYLGITAVHRRMTAKERQAFELPRPVFYVCDLISIEWAVEVWPGS
ncbi:hypothetical protein M2164_002960 [Streptomyces sp. SAI-208]|uniref:hypothetical protein n=1 Tax=Streptomyces sp. SAI-208 TaxID=2940550 RepID=UPI00247727A2|nr:hypothetical protein [Streptomyces sp. SAI-208]MDH6607325.1 hypothetical protein [Streptomyces sp. SAI-208]